MNDSTRDPEEYREKWESYIKKLKRINYNLPYGREEELDELIEGLLELVDLAVKVQEYEICWNCEKDIGGEEQERCGHCGVPIK